MLKINTAEIENAANQIKSINEELSQVLESSKSTVQGMNSVWSGPAAEAVIDAFSSFAAKYEEKYRQVLNQYEAFLKNAAAAGYEETESKGQSIGGKIADMI